MTVHAFTPLRREDPALLTGQGVYTSDVRLPGMLHAVFVRAQVAQGVLNPIDGAAAQAMPGVVAVLTGQSLIAYWGAMPCMPEPNPLLPILTPKKFGVLAYEQVSYVGQPVALVVAQTQTQALAAAQAVVMVVDAITSEEDAVAMTHVTHQCGPMNSAADSAHQVSVDLTVPRILAMAMEPRGMVAQWAEDRMTLWLGTQTPSRAQADIAATLALPLNQVRIIAGDVGGAFGAKSSLCPEDLVLALAAKQLHAAVRWLSTRSDEFTSGMHGRGAQLTGTLSVAADGQLQLLKAQMQFDLGAWCPFSAVVPLRNAARILPGPYQVRTLDVQGSAYPSHRAPVTIYRGAGRPEAALLMETLMDKAARALAMDPVNLRLRNLIPTSAMPYSTPTGELLDSGDYLKALNLACAQFDYPAQRIAQRQRRAAGEVVGIGIGMYIEPCGMGWESAQVELHADGRATVASGSPAQGQGHATTYANIAAKALGIDAHRVTVLMGDTALCPPGVGALASRSTAIAGSAIVQACHDLQARQQAGEALPLRVTLRYEAAEAWSYGCVIARMAIHRDTGQPHIEQIVWADDAGQIIHPELAKGQLIGGLAQGLGQAMLEQLRYDNTGQLITGSLMDYAVPRADDIPPLSITSFSTPSPHNLLGAKGVGEAGCIGVPAALMNAARDALSPLGECDLQFPLTAEQLWRAMHDQSH